MLLFWILALHYRNIYNIQGTTKQLEADRSPRAQRACESPGHVSVTWRVWCRFSSGTSCLTDIVDFLVLCLFQNFPLIFVPLLLLRRLNYKLNRIAISLYWVCLLITFPTVLCWDNTQLVKTVRSFGRMLSVDRTNGAGFKAEFSCVKQTELQSFFSEDSSKLGYTGSLGGKSGVDER